MYVSFTGSVGEMPYPIRVVTTGSAKPSEIESQVLVLFEQFHDPILRYTISFGISIQDAEEIAQEVFLALFRHLQAGKSQANLRGWIFRVAHNLALKQRISNHKLHTSLDQETITIDSYLDSSPDPEEQVFFAQRQNRLLAVVNALPETDQQCLRLRAEGLRYREIAAVLGISLGSVSISLTRSLARLNRAEGR